MTALAIIVTVCIVVGLLAFALADIAAGDEEHRHADPPPTVDGGWRAFG